ncbi:glycoside hydrolase family 1 protein [Trichoderma afarasin]
MSIIILLSVISAFSILVNAQQKYILTTGPTARPQCSATRAVSPTFSFSTFAFTQSDTYRYAIPIPSPTSTETFAAPFSALRRLLPPVPTTTWGSWDPNATVTATDFHDRYGSASWTALWENARPFLTNFTSTGIYSTTVSPTPVPSAELILPPRDYFGPTDCYYFPDGFIYGVAGSAAQIEGAISHEGKAPSAADIIAKDGPSPDYVTNENYYLYKQDIERLAAIGVKYYSFSIPWTRILPFAVPGSPVNQQAIDHYNDLLDFVIAKGMLPVVTLIHFDTPLQFYAANVSSLYEKPTVGYNNGAYQNETFLDSFVHYGKIVMTHFADRVPLWVTFNEPFVYCQNGKSVDTVLKAHAQLYHFYHDQIKGTGKVGMKFSNLFGVPLDPLNASHVEAANDYNNFQLAIFGNPVYLGKDYPAVYKERVSDYVPLTKEDLRYIKGTADFWGTDAYTITVVSPLSASESPCLNTPSNVFYPECVQQSWSGKFGWNVAYASQTYVYITPTYLRHYLSYLWNTYRSPIIITEFGFPIENEAALPLAQQLFDSPRSQYYLSFMSEILNSIWEDGVQVLGVIAWSFVDNWEFGDFTPHYGMQIVDRTTQERQYKKSLFDFVDFIQARTWPKHFKTKDNS